MSLLRSSRSLGGTRPCALRLNALQSGQYRIIHVREIEPVGRGCFTPTENNFFGPTTAVIGCFKPRKLLRTICVSSLIKPLLLALFSLLFVVFSRLGALQRNPTAGAVFSALSERIRSDLGAEEAAVYIDIGDGTLWLLPTGGGGGGEGEAPRGGGGEEEEEEEVFIQRGVGVVGLVAMGALPGVAAVAAGGGERAGGVDGGVDVLLLNDGLEAFDNGTTVEAGLLRAAWRRRAGVGGGAGTGGDAAAEGGAVRNMLLAR